MPHFRPFSHVLVTPFGRLDAADTHAVRRCKEAIAKAEGRAT